MKRIGQPGQVQLLKAAFRARQADIRTSCPGLVIDYDSAKQTATVQLAVRLPDVNGVPQELPPLTDVPVKWQRGGGYFCTMPLAEGDPGLLVFCEADFNKWRATGAVSDVVQERRHGLYAYFLPGGCDDASPIADASADHMVCGKDGGPVIHIKPSGIDLGAAVSGFVALAAKCDAEFTKIKNNIAQLAAPPGTSGGPLVNASPYVTASVAATKVKAE